MHAIQTSSNKLKYYYYLMISKYSHHCEQKVKLHYSPQIMA